MCIFLNPLPKLTTPLPPITSVNSSFQYFSFLASCHDYLQHENWVRCPGGGWQMLTWIRVLGFLIPTSTDDCWHREEVGKLPKNAIYEQSHSWNIENRILLINYMSQEPPSSSLHFSLLSTSPLFSKAGMNIPVPVKMLTKFSCCSNNLELIWQRLFVTFFDWLRNI
jgi:hypothetical protein